MKMTSYLAKKASMKESENKRRNTAKESRSGENGGENPSMKRKLTKKAIEV